MTSNMSGGAPEYDNEREHTINNTYGAELGSEREADDLVAACLLADVPVMRRTQTATGKHRVEVPMRYLVHFARLLRRITERDERRSPPESAGGNP